MDNPASASLFQAGDTLEAVQRSGVLNPLEAKILLGHALGLSRVSLITQSQRSLSAQEAEQLSALFQWRKSGEPIAYILGQREFYGLPFKVSPAVLIPRPETELLVDLALERLSPGERVLDMGTGSGAIAIALAHSRPALQVSALDASAAALEVAQANAAALLGEKSLRLLQSDWYGALGGERFDMIVSNPPYIEKDDLHLGQGDLRFEPIDALTDQADGLSALRTIIAGAPAHLEKGGWILLEHGYDQALEVRKLLQAGGFGEVQSWRDLAGIERISGGVLE